MGTQYSLGHPASNNPVDYLRPSRLDIYLEPDPRLNAPKSRFTNTQHSNVSTINDSDSPVKPSPQSKRFSYGDNYTHFPNI